MGSSALPAVFLHNAAVVVSALLLAIVLRRRWLIALIAWGCTIGASYLWKDISLEWYLPWKKYIYEPVIEGTLWRSPTTDAEIIGVLIFWLLPLGLGYVVALACIARTHD